MIATTTMSTSVRTALGGMNARRVMARDGFMARVEASTRAVNFASSSRRLTTSMKGSGKFIVGGNWKCNGTVESVKSLVMELNAGKIDADLDIYVAPPAVHIPVVQSTLNSRFQVAAQNCWVGPGGAFTGELSADMLVDSKIPWVILGHSERRALCGETNEFVGEKTKYALSKGLKVALCIGETLEQREAGTTLDVCRAQLKAVNDVVSVADWENIVIAYEPVWAIGTGKVATPQQAQDVHAGIRQWCAENISAEVASKVRIQYGGSVNAGNCEELAQKEDIDGFLVGGASLIGDAFVTICNSAKMSK